MEDFLVRAAAVLGDSAMEKLSHANVLIVGLGGVGSYALEAIVRGGVGRVTIMDGDEVQRSNVNRQLCALHSTIGKPKAEVLKERALDINPNCHVSALDAFYTEENAKTLDLTIFDYVVDAIDSVKDKVTLISNAKAVNVKIISAMGAGNKADPTAFEVSDIYKTSVCPLAKVMRRELKAQGVKELKCVYSKEEPMISTTENGRRITGSLSFVPGVMGLIMAGEVIKDLIREDC